MSGSQTMRRGCARVCEDDVDRVMSSAGASPPFPRALREHALVNRASVLVAMALLSEDGRCVTTTAVVAALADVAKSTVRLSLHDLSDWGLVSATQPRPPDAPARARCVTISKLGLVTARLFVRSMAGATRAGDGS